MFFPTTSKGDLGMARTKQQAPFTAKTIVISGKGYEICMKNYTPLKPNSSRRKGVGFQYLYRIDSKAALQSFIDYFMDRANEFANKMGDDHPNYLQLVKDVERLFAELYPQD
jgi:hypothetical protein